MSSRIFTISEAEVLPPADVETLVGTLNNLDQDRLRILGQEVHLSDSTSWDRDRSSENASTRVRIQGHYRSPRKFSARKVRYRSLGRDKIAGRIDRITPVDGGLLLQVMGFRLLLPDDEALLSEGPIGALQKAAARAYSTMDVLPMDDDDAIPGRYSISKYLTMGARVELSGALLDNFDLDDERARDRRNYGASVRSEFIWAPPGSFSSKIGFRHSYRYRSNEVDPNETRNRSLFNELYGYWSDVGTRGLDLQIGRQDFDDPREWIYDQNLDALRAIYRQPAYRLELSASKVLRGGGARDEATHNLIAYLSNNNSDRHLAAYIVDRRDKRTLEDYPLHFGLRALGDWLPNQSVWAEWSLLRGYQGTTDLSGYGFDLGTTWSPSTRPGLYLSAGYAFGSGDDTPSDNIDQNFRQTGFQDNNGRFGGVTSFRYYGELVDPELINMGVLTLGVGHSLGRRRSIDLVFHTFQQDVASANLTGTGLRQKPDGLHDDLGWELDLIYGDRSNSRFDMELVLGMFEPGGAFPGADAAFLLKLQLRFAL